MWRSEQQTRMIYRGKKSKKDKEEFTGQDLCRQHFFVTWERELAPLQRRTEAVRDRWKDFVNTAVEARLGQFFSTIDGREMLLSNQIETPLRMSVVKEFVNSLIRVIVKEEAASWVARNTEITDILRELTLQVQLMKSTPRLQGLFEQMRRNDLRKAGGSHTEAEVKEGALRLIDDAVNMFEPLGKGVNPWQIRNQLKAKTLRQEWDAELVPGYVRYWSRKLQAIRTFLAPLLDISHADAASFARIPSRTPESFFVQRVILGAQTLEPETCRKWMSKSESHEVPAHEIEGALQGVLTVGSISVAEYILIFQHLHRFQRSFAMSIEVVEVHANAAAAESSAGQGDATVLAPTSEEIEAARIEREEQLRQAQEKEQQRIDQDRDQVRQSEALRRQLRKAVKDDDQTRVAELEGRLRKLHL